MTNDVVSLPIAKKLKEAGWDQLKNGWYHLLDSKKRLVVTTQSYEAKKHNSQRIAAPTIADLLEALPWGYRMVKMDNGLFCVWASQDRLDLHHADPNQEFTATNPADALALLWMALKEKGIV